MELRVIFVIVSLFLISQPECTEAFSQKRCKNGRPVIGILTQRVTSSSLIRHFSWTKGRSYFAASYVKYIEAAGARVIPIRNDITSKDLIKILDSINGVVFPGGAVSLSSSKYARTGRRIFDYAKRQNDKGEYFPILGICLGFQLLTKFAAGSNLLRRTYSTHVSLKMKLAPPARQSRMFKRLSSAMKQMVATRALSYNNHRWGIYLSTYRRNRRLRQFFKNLATSKDRKGVQFVAAIEANNYPIYGVQWHPEKPPFEWYPKLNMNRSPEMISFSQYLGNFFVDEARKSCHKFDSPSNQNRGNLIYDYLPLYSRQAGSSFEQVYIF